MNILIAEDLAIEAPALRDLPAVEISEASAHLHCAQPVLTEQQEAFLHDRFTTKLEDPQTGRWIRSWRAEGTTP